MQPETDRRTTLKKGVPETNPTDALSALRLLSATLSGTSVLVT